MRQEEEEEVEDDNNDETELNQDLLNWVKELIQTEYPQINDEIIQKFKTGLRNAVSSISKQNVNSIVRRLEKNNKKIIKKIITFIINHIDNSFESLPDNIKDTCGINNLKSFKKFLRSKSFKNILTSYIDFQVLSPISKWIYKTVQNKDVIITMLGNKEQFFSGKTDFVHKCLISSYDNIPEFLKCSKDFANKKNFEKFITKLLKSSPGLKDCILDYLNNIILETAGLKDNPNRKQKVHNILLFGPTGAGKSSLILITAMCLNFNLNKEDALQLSHIKVGDHARGTYESLSTPVVTNGTNKIRFWDVPGTADANKQDFSDDDITCKIKEHVKDTDLDAILLCQQAGTESRVNDTVRNSIKAINNTFKDIGPEFWKKVVIVITKANAFGNSTMRDPYSLMKKCSRQKPKFSHFKDSPCCEKYTCLKEFINVKKG